MAKEKSSASKITQKSAGSLGSKNKKPRRATEADRQMKIQEALYKIADAASAVTDMHTFYAALHRIVGKLMYARNFYVTLYDPDTQIMSAPYFADEAGDVAPPPAKLEEFSKTLRAHVLRTGRTLHLSREQIEVGKQRGRFTPMGTPAEDWIGVPLKADGQVIGMLTVQSYKKGVRYEERDVQLLKFVAQHIAVALTRARAIEETRQRNAELQIINSVQQGLASNLDMQGIYDLVGDKVRNVFDAQGVSIGTYDPVTNLLHFRYSIQEGERIEYDPMPLPDKGFRAHIIRTRRPLRLDNVEAEGIAYGLAKLTPANAPIKAKPGMPKSWLGVPLLVGGEARGMVNLYNVDRTDAYDDSDVRLLETLANSMSVALENARLFDETQRLLKETEDRAAELAVINSVQEGLASKLDMQEIYDLVGTELRNIFNAQVVMISTYDHETETIEHRYAIERGERVYAPGHHPIRGFRTQIVETRRSVLVNTNVEEQARRLGQPTLPGTIPPKSWLGVPMMVGEKVTGILSLQNVEEEYAFNEADVRLLETFAASMSVALENARLFDETQSLLKETEQRNVELQIINSVQEALASKLDLQAIYELIGEKVREVFNVQVVDITTYDANAHLISMPYSYEKGDRSVFSPREPYGFRLHVINSAAPFLINQNFVELASQYNNPLLTGAWPKSALFMPLLAEGRVKSIISIQDLERENAFSPSDVQLLQTLSNAMSVAIENARLFDETQRLLKETEQRARELATVNTVSAALVGELDLTALIELVGEQIRSIFKADIAFVALLDQENNVINFPYQYGEHHEPLQLGQGLTSQIIQRGEPLLINQDMDRQRERMGVIRVGIGARSFLGVPIFLGGEAIGVVSVQNTKQEGSFTENDQRLLSTIAANVGIAFQNARLFEETQRLFQAEQRAHEQAETLRSVAQALNRSLSLTEVFDLALTEIQKVIPYDSAGIYQVHENRRVMVSGRGFTNLDDLIGISFEFNRQDDEIGYLISQSLQPLILEDASETYPQYFSTGSHAATTIRSYMAVPIVLNQNLIGMITLDREEPGFYNDHHGKLAMAFAAQAASALNNARLFDEVQTKNAEITESLERETASNNILQVIAESPTDVQPVLEVIARNAAQLSGSEDAIIGIREGEMLIVSTHYGDIPMIPVGDGIRFNRDSVAGRAILEGQPRQWIHNQPGVESEYPAGDEVAKKYGYRMTCAVPLLREGKAIGAISIRRTKPELLTEKQIALIQSFANQAAIAVENVRLFKAEKQRVAELQIINSIQQGLAAELDFQAIVDLVGDKLREVFNTPDLGINWYDEKANILHHLYNYEHGKRQFHSPTPPTPGGLFESLVKLRQPLVWNAPAEYIGEPFAGTDQSKSLASIPIISSDRVLGSIFLENYERENAYGESELRLLTTIAASLGTALENARLFDETQRLFKAEQERNAELAVINEVGQGLAKELHFQAIIDLVGDKVRNIFNAQATMIFLYDAATKILSYPYFHKHGQRFHSDPRQINPQMDPGFLALIIRTQQRVVINQDLEQEMLKVGESLMSGTTMFESMAYVPILAGDQVIGVLGLESRDKNAFPEPAVNLLTTIAANLGVALENARLFDETQQRNAELAIINSVQEGLASKLDMQEIYELVGEKLREVFQHADLSIGVYDPETDLASAPIVIEHGKRISFPTVKLNGRGFIGHMLHDPRPLLFNSEDEMKQAMIEYQSADITGGGIPKSALYVPLIMGGIMRGAVVLQDKQNEHAFKESDVRLLDTLTDSMSVALENARLWEQEKMYRKALQRELEIGREIQAGFIPDMLPIIEGWEIAAALMSAREVAGDFYDAFELPDGTIGLVIADVCDKGVGAALFMTLFRSLVRAVSNLDYFEHTEQVNAPHSTTERLQRAITLTNNYIAETHGNSGMFATIFFGILDPRDGKLAYINGGHEPPLIIHSGDVREALYKTGPAVGAIMDSRYQTHETQLNAGDIFFAFTDGVPECTDPRNEFYGRERLLDLLHQASGSAHEVVKTVQTELHQYIANATQFDDITLLAVRRG